MQQKIHKARLLLMKKKHFAFISSMLYRLKFEENRSIPSMYYSGTESTIYLNPDWFLSLSDQEACSALAHETLHYALQHDIRKGGRDPSLYNKAADHVVNNLLMDYGFELPSDVPVDRRFQNKTVEYVYKFMEEEDNKNQDQPSDSPFGSDISFNDMPSGEEQSRRNRETLSSDQQEQQATGKSIGTDSSTIEALFNQIKDGRIDWSVELIQYMDEKSKGEPSFIQLDRRMLSLGYYIPDKTDINQIDRIAIAIDISGSVTEEQIEYFLRECRAVKNTLNPKTLDVVSFNTEITGIWTFTEDQELTDIKMDINGGTSLRDVWNHYSQDENKPNFLLVFSDMYVHIPEKPEYDVIWCVVEHLRFKEPYGKAIHINEEMYNESSS